MCCEYLQSQNSDFLYCESYIYKWTARPRFPVNQNNILEQFHIKLNYNDIDKRCIGSYNDFSSQLKSRKSLPSSHNKNDNIYALSNFYFISENGDTSKLSITFDMDGNYCIEQVWYVIDNVLFYYLFKYLNDEIINNKILKESINKISRQGLCFYNND